MRVVLDYVYTDFLATDFLAQRVELSGIIPGPRHEIYIMCTCLNYFF